MTDIDPVEFGEMRAHVKNTCDDVSEIKTMLKDNMNDTKLLIQGVNVKADGAHEEITKMKTAQEATAVAEAKAKRKLGIIYGTIASVAGFLGGIIKGLLA
tara:strand:+ start:362 stop:661 length:300 start_codon:yes stop_codon:yes gene_type:complete